MSKSSYVVISIICLFFSNARANNWIPTEKNPVHEIQIKSHSLKASEGTRYQWYLNNIQIDGGTFQELEVSSAGIYKLEMTDLTGAIIEKQTIIGLTNTGAIIRIFTIGDSTVQDYAAGYYPRKGWGQVLPIFFNAGSVTVINKAVGGTSSKSFYNTFWTDVRNSLQPGDFVFIQFGINDRNNADPARYTPTGGEFESYLTKYVTETKAKGAFPVLVATLRRNAWNENGTVYDAYHDHPVATRTVAKNLGVPLIDLDAKAKVLLESVGETYATRFLYNNYVAGEYPNYKNGNTDNVHFQEMGAIEMAKLVAQGIRELNKDPNVSKLIPFLKPEYQLAVSVNPTGSDIATTHTTTYPQGLTITLKTLPKTTNTFQKWNNAAGGQISTATMTTVSSGTSATSYTAMYKGATSCSAAITSPTNAICGSGSILLTANTGVSYKWFNGTTLVGTASTYTANAAGNYTVEVTTNGCKATSAGKVISANPLPIITPYAQIDAGAWTNTSSATVCEGSTLNFGHQPKIATGWSWTGPANFTSTLRDPILPAIVSAQAGNYIATYTDANGCKASSSFALDVVKPVATISSPSTSICSGGFVVLTASTGSAYKWFNGTYQIGTASTVTVTTAGSYTVEVTTNGCKAVSDATQLTESALPSITHNIKVDNGAWSAASSATVCEASTINFGPHPNLATGWSWTGPNNFNSSLRDPILNPALSTHTGTYTATYTDPNGCKATSDFVLQIDKPTATITSPSTSICAGNSVVLSANTGSIYKWFKGTNPLGTAATLSVTEAGLYTVEVTNNNGCKAVSDATQITVTNTILWYADTDNDGKGDPTQTVASCTKPKGYVAVAGDACPTDVNKTTAGNCGCGKTETECLDCAGTVNGTAIFDNCNICVGGTTGNMACISTGTMNARTENIQVVPQPFDVNTTIKLENQGNILSITLTNASGAIVKTVAEINSNEITVGEDLASGLYSVLIQSEKGIILTKIIKK